MYLPFRWRHCSWLNPEREQKLVGLNPHACGRYTWNQDILVLAHVFVGTRKMFTIINLPDK